MIRLSCYHHVRDLRRHGKLKGKVYSISNSELRGVQVDGKIRCLVPSWGLVSRYKHEGLSEEEFIDRYREELRRNWKNVKRWLNGLEDDDEIWLCCWEREGEFCHRRLVYKMLVKWRSDLKVELR